MLKYNNVLIYGYSTSGKAVEKALLRFNIKYKIYDDNQKVFGGNFLNKLSESTVKNFDLVVISPGVSIYNKSVKMIESCGIKIVSELEFGFWLCKPKIIAITGTNGKTTTVSLLKHILQGMGQKVEAFGNIGEPLTNVVNYNDLDYAIVEVSSFQLEAVYAFKPYIGIILNIDEDHIDRHKSKKKYINAKFELFKNSDNNNFAILNADDENIMTNVNKVICNKIFLSEKNVVQGVYVQNDTIYYKDNDKVEKIIDKKELLGFNTFLTNIMAIFAVLKLLQLNVEHAIEHIKTFNWLPNRMELAGVLNKVKYINDSKGTNIHATYNAIKIITDNITLLLGGQDKNLNFDTFFNTLPGNVKHVIFFGEAKNKIYKCCKKYYFTKSSCKVKNLKQAVNLASRVTKENEVILLSPACSSFDQYTSYKQRGEHFKELVNSLNKNKVINKKQINNKMIIRKD